MDRFDNPIDAWIIADCFVLRINQYHFEVFVGGVLVNPIRVQDTEIRTSTSDTLLSCRFEGTLVLELINALVGRLAWSAESLMLLFGSHVTNRTWHP